MHSTGDLNVLATDPGGSGIDLYMKTLSGSRVRGWSNLHVSILVTFVIGDLHLVLYIDQLTLS